MSTFPVQYTETAAEKQEGGGIFPRQTPLDRAGGMCYYQNCLK